MDNNLTTKHIILKNKNMDLKLDFVPLTHECLGKCVQRRAFFIEFSLGGNVLKGHSKWLKRAPYALLMLVYIGMYETFIYIYVCACVRACVRSCVRMSVSFYPYGCTLTTASRYKINVTLISQNFLLHVSSNLQVSTFDSRLNFTRRAPFRG